MPTTNDPSTNQNPQTAANAQIAAKPEDNFDFDINLDTAPKSELENQEIDINREVETKTEEIVAETNIGDNLSIDLPETYTSTEKTTEPVDIKPVELTPSVEKPIVSEDTSWLKVQDEENKKSEESLFGVADNGIANSNPLKMDDDTEVKEEVSINSKTISLNDRLWDTTPVDINKVEIKNEQFDIEKTDYSNDMKIIEWITGVKPIEGTISSNPVPVLDSVSLPNNETTNSINLDMLVWANTQGIESEVKNEGTGNVKEEVEASNTGNGESLYPNLLKGISVEQKQTETQSEIKKDDASGPTSISQSLNMELNAISPDAPEEVKKTPNHLLKFLLPAWVIVIILVLLYFVGTTMFPMETGNIVEDAPQIVEETTEQTWSNEELTWSDMALADTWSMSGDIVLPEWDTVTEPWHAAAGEEIIDPIWELNTDTASQWQLESLSLVDKIKLMADEANTFLSEGQSTNNKVYIKYGGTISKKCTELVWMLENRQEIDNLSWNLAQLEGYLQKLRDLKNANTWNSWWILPQETSGQDTQEPANQAATFTAE